MYTRRIFMLGDLALGLYGRSDPGCSAVLCDCNAGLRQTFLSVLDPATGAHTAHPHVGSFSWPVNDCANSFKVIRRPVLFAHLVGTDDPIWSGIARDVGRGIRAAFAAANAIGGIAGRPFKLIQRNFSGDAGLALEAVAGRYPLVGLLGSVLPASVSMHSPIPAIGSLEMALEPGVAPFVAADIRVQVSLSVLRSGRALDISPRSRGHLNPTPQFRAHPHPHHHPHPNHHTHPHPHSYPPHHCPSPSSSIPHCHPDPYWHVQLHRIPKIVENPRDLFGICDHCHHF